MRRVDARTLVAQAVIAGAACAAGQALFVEPLEHDLADARGVLTRLEAEAGEIDQTRNNLPGLMRNLALASRQARRIDAQGACARDDGAAFAAIMRLASEVGITIHSIDPRAEEKRRRTESDASLSAVRISYAMAISGSFSDLLVFLDELPRRAGFVRIDSISVAPDYAGGHGAILAAVETSHYAFDCGPIELAQHGEDDE